MAGGTGTYRDHKAAARAHLARAFTGGAGLGLGTGLGARTAARIAVFVAEEIDRLFAAESRLLEGDGDAVLQVIALDRAGPPRTAAHAAKEGIKDAFKAAHAAKPAEIKATCTAAAAHLRAVKTELVVAFALFGVAEDLIGLVELLEALFGVFVVGVQVGMAFLGFLAVRAFDFGLGGIPAYAQHLIIIALCQKAHLLTFKTCCIYRPNAPARVREEVPPPRRG